AGAGEEGAEPGRHRRNFPGGRQSGGVAPGSQNPEPLSSCPLRPRPSSGGSQRPEIPKPPLRPRPPPGWVSPRARRCHYTPRDPRAGPVFPEA
ncbi:hypothetical protein P7K49_035352, partial [Saguinus oedipus]